MIASAKTLVVKVGSSLVTDEGRGLDAAAIARWAAQIARLRELGRRVQRRRCMPSAMAPLDTRMVRRPSSRSFAICAAQRAMAAASSPRPSSVTSEEPTFTTSVFAAAIIGAPAPAPPPCIPRRSRRR